MKNRPDDNSPRAAVDFVLEREMAQMRDLRLRVAHLAYLRDHWRNRCISLRDRVGEVSDELDSAAHALNIEWHERMKLSAENQRLNDENRELRSRLALVGRAK